MATKQGRLTIGLYMSETNPKTKTNKVSTISIIAKSAAVDAYNAAADDTARAATAIGNFLDDLDNLTLGVRKEVQVGYAYESNSAPPAVTVFALDKDKFLISSRDATNSDPVKLSIPARNDLAVTVESDGVTLDITAGDLADFVTHYEAIALSGDLNNISVLRAVISK